MNGVKSAVPLYFLKLLFFWVVLIVAEKPLAQPAPGGPVEISRMTVDEVIDDMLRNEALYTSDKGKLDEMVERRLLPRFNFSVMTQLAAGKYWREANSEQKAALVNEFRILLIRTYSNMLFSNIDKVYSYRNASVSIGSSKTLPNGDVTVEMKISRNARESVSVSLRMRRDGPDWKVIDVSANGVSLVVTYRASFVREANLSGIEGLIKSLSDRNRANSGRQDEQAREVIAE